MDRIIVGVDFSPTSEEAASRAAAMAVATGARLSVVTAVKGGSTQVVSGGGTDTWVVNDTHTANTNLEVLLGSLRSQFGEDLAADHSVLTGKADDALLDEAQRIDADLIVVGNKRVHGATRVLGSVALHVVRHAPCDVLIAHTT